MIWNVSVLFRDGGSRDLSLNSNGYSVQFLSDYNIQDGNFPSGV